LIPSYQGAITFALDVVRARNRVAAMFLTQPEFAEFTHLLFVDDDQWPEDVRIVPEMIVRCRGVLAAPYTNKKAPLRWTYQKIPNGLLVGMGFTMLTRECLATVAESAKWYTDLPGMMKTPNVFGQLIERVGDLEALLSEDYSFCVRAHRRGIPVELYEQSGIINHAGGHVWNARQMAGGVVPQRGVDYPCEGCGKKEGSTLNDGWQRCNACGYPSK
jgi:hypothetical protein